MFVNTCAVEKADAKIKFDLLQDSRFNHDIDLMTGYKTRSMICMPIKDANGDVIGVAQVRNSSSLLW